MKLSGVLLRIAKRFPKGDIFRGKYRLVKKVTPLLVANKRAQLELEERNMFYLRNPFLNREQCANVILFNHKKKFFEEKCEEKVKIWRRHKLLGDRFGFLKVADRWE